MFQYKTDVFDEVSVVYGSTCDDKYYRIVVDALVRSGIIRRSEMEKREYSGYVCVDPKTNEVISIFVDHIGSIYHTKFTKGRVCSGETIQYSFHTHPSGRPNPSDVDMNTIIKRVGKIEQGSCIVCNKGYFCVLSRNYG